MDDALRGTRRAVAFDYIAELLLPDLCPARGGDRFVVGKMACEVVVVPGLRTIRATTLERLAALPPRDAARRAPSVAWARRG